MIAFFFPGQGSQAPGMGKALAERHEVARRTYDEADDALGFSIRRLCFEGSEDDLKRTEHTQPAILATSVAILRVMRALRPELSPSVVLGHSLGEWTALVAADAIDFAAAVRAVHQRGRFMQAAVPEGVGAMSAVLGLDGPRIAEICREVSAPGAEVSAANFNAPEQTVISGHRAAVEAAGERLLAAGAKKLSPLPVSAPFHSPLMATAANALREVLVGLELRAPTVPVITNVEAAPTQDPERLRALLVEQVTAPVRWVECVSAANASLAFEVGPGRVLKGLVKRIARDLEVRLTDTPEALEAALA